MYQFGSRSKAKLAQCDFRLRALFEAALFQSPVDITIIHGYRTNEEQDEIFAQGLSKLKGGESFHNFTVDGQPNSRAVDFAPWVNGGVDWNDTHMFAVIAGVLYVTAQQQGIKLRWGGDWDMDGSTRDQTFMDWGHVELVL